ncbi:MAG: DUF3109 family protein [Bacteroidia bacterium]|nr:DUF3109 family protein [Bacteroidia bacterium]
MIQIGDKLVSADVIEEQFVCDLKQCKGACCVEGDSGAPLEEHELAEIEKSYPVIEKYLTEEGRSSIDRFGLYFKDLEGDWVTPLVKGYRECAYTLFENGVAQCAFEKAYFAGEIAFRKPVSCHLYPIRIQQLRNYEAVNYDRWEICSAACSLGKALKVPVYKFLKDALIRKYSEDWYKELEVVAGLYLKEKNGA